MRELGAQQQNRTKNRTKTGKDKRQAHKQKDAPRGAPRWINPPTHPRSINAVILEHLLQSQLEREEATWQTISGPNSERTTKQHHQSWKS